MTPLERRILDCFPSGEYAVTALLRVLEVVESEQVQTAAIGDGAQPRLLINPSFAARHAATPERLFMLVMHELHHVLLGHTRMFPTATAVDNFVFDCVINSMLARMFPQPEYLSLFTELYSEREFPACLLRPRLRAGRLRRKLHPAALARLPNRRRSAVAEVYRSLYSRTGAAYDELRDALPAALDQEEVAQVPLLGGHGGETDSGQDSAGEDRGAADPDGTAPRRDASEDGHAESRPGEAERKDRRNGGETDSGQDSAGDGRGAADPDGTAPRRDADPNEGGRAGNRPGETERKDRRDSGKAGDGRALAGEDRVRHDSLTTSIVLEAARLWEPGPALIRGRSLNELLREGDAALRPVRSNRAVLRGLLHRLGTSSATGPVRGVAERPVPIATAVPGADRRALVLHALGVQTLLYRSQGAMTYRDRSAKVHVYADVSGSMGDAIGAVYAAVADCRRWVHPKVHLFSTRIHDATLAEIRAGAVRTTGGTDIACVAEHMAEHDVRRACIITDGYVGAPTNSHRETLAKTKLGVAWIGPYAGQADLKGVANWTATLKDNEDDQP